MMVIAVAFVLPMLDFRRESRKWTGLDYRRRRLV